jgi:uncharacterized protein YbcV (DUF1398 family)
LISSYLEIILFIHQEWEANMFDKEKILEIIQTSREEKWPYPRVFEALKHAGVESYEVNVATHEVVYHGHNQNMIEKSTGNEGLLTVAPHFSLSNLQQAILRNQKDAHYPRFLQDIAAAGVACYEVNMKQRKVIYSGKNKEQYAEAIPTFTS